MKYEVPKIARTNHFINRVVVSAFAEGCGGDVFDTTESHPDYDCVATYGILRGTAEVMKKAKEYWYIDRGYFEPGKADGSELKYFRVTRNASLHTGAGNHDWDRFEKFNYILEPWKKDGKNILVVPPNKPMADFLGINNWIGKTLAQIVKNTDRDIVMSRKTNAPSTNPLLYSKAEKKITQVKSRQQEFDEALRSAWVVVTDYSNAMVQALIRGVPVICTHSNRKISSISEIENPTYDREFLKNLAYNQWTLDEMRSGQTWRELNEWG